MKYLMSRSTRCPRPSPWQQNLGAPRHAAPLSAGVDGDELDGSAVVVRGSVAGEERSGAVAGAVKKRWVFFGQKKWR
jgi:hypothetical protein